MKRKGEKYRYRFTFFQRQFVTHMIVSLLILVLLASAFVYDMDKRSYESERDELVSATRVITRLLLKEDEEPTLGLQAYRNMLGERKISFIIMEKSGDIVYRDPKMPAALRSKPFLDGLRSHIFTMKDYQAFEASVNKTDPYLVVPRLVRLKTQGKDLFLFVFSPLGSFRQILATINDTYLYMIGIVFVLATAVSLLVTQNISRSILALRRSTQQIAQGNYAARSPVKRSDELGDLSNDFNTMAARLEEASNKINQYEARRREFLSDVTHELRTPLTSIRGIIEGLKSGLVTQDENHKYYGIIEKETFRLIRLINELLDMEKIESGLITLNKQTISLRDLFEIVAESLEVHIQEKKLQIVIECEPHLTVYGDYDRLTQIMINLAKNSIQFTDFGTVRLSAAETEQLTRIEIADTGKGMTPEEQSRIWERFFKADPSRYKYKSETGLGLSIVKQLVEAHGGSISVSSTPGIGTTFTIVLPKSDSADVQAAMPERTKPVPLPGQSSDS